MCLCTIFFLINLDVVLIVYNPFYPTSKRYLYYNIIIALVIILWVLDKFDVTGRAERWLWLNQEDTLQSLRATAFIFLPIYIILLLFMTWKLLCRQRPNKKLRVALMWRYYLISLATILYLGLLLVLFDDNIGIGKDVAR